jgi:hypothetical protein
MIIFVDLLLGKGGLVAQAAEPETVVIINQPAPPTSAKSQMVLYSDH